MFDFYNSIIPNIDFDLATDFRLRHAQYLVSPYVVPDIPAPSIEEEIASLQEQENYLTALLKDIKKRIAALKHEETDEVPSFIPDCVSAI